MTTPFDWNEATNESIRQRVAELLNILVDYPLDNDPYLAAERQRRLRGCPNWPDDLNAAAELLERMKFYFLRYTEDFPERGKWVVQHLATQTDYVFDDNPARAICIAFIEMMEGETK